MAFDSLASLECVAQRRFLRWSLNCLFIEVARHVHGVREHHFEGVQDATGESRVLADGYATL